MSDVMSADALTTSPDTRLEEAAWLMREHHISGLPVVDPLHHVVGIVSESDIVRGLDRATGIESPRGLLDLLLASAPPRGESLLEVCRSHLKNARVRDVMSRRVVTVDRDAPLAEAARRMRVNGVKRLPVVDTRGRLTGILTRADIVQAVSGEVRVHRGALHPSVAGRPVPAAGPYEDV
ncbi:MAG TPA: CBS domain-containing protein [Thermoplasmata archaeon]|nr:CBS domain-containing protein [Thermoplasmata archaeon]